MQFDHYSIRPLALSDLDAYYAMVDKNRKRLADFFAGTVSRTATLEDTKIFLADIVERAKDRTYFPFVIIDNTQEAIIGFLDLKNLDWNLPKSEMGLYMDVDHGGQGISHRAMDVFCTYCFETYGFEKLFLRTHKTNAAAVAIAEKCGFILEGTLRKDYKTTSGELVDLLYFGRLRNESA